MTNYLEDVKQAIKTYLEDNEAYIIMSDFDDIDDFQDVIYERMFISDSVTGNASGSYTFNSHEAMENVFSDPDTVQDALREFDVSAETIADNFLNGNWEYFDVTARCYILGSALSEYIEENRDDIEQAIENAHI